jgi:hypothetical protein
VRIVEGHVQEIADMVGVLTIADARERVMRKDVVVNWRVYQEMPLETFFQHLQEMQAFRRRA